MDGDVELKAPTNVGTVSNPRILGELFPGCRLAGLWEPPPLPSLTNIPRVLVTPLGSTNRIEELGSCTALMLIFGIRAYPGFMAFRFSFGDGVWQKVVAAVPSRNTLHTETKRTKALMEISPTSQGRFRGSDARTDNTPGRGLSTQKNLGGRCCRVASWG